MAELMAEDPKSAAGIAEAAGDIGGGLSVDEEGTQGLVLTLHRELGREEERLVGRENYLIWSTSLHINMMLQKHYEINLF